MDIPLCSLKYLESILNRDTFGGYKRQQEHGVYFV